MWEYFKVMLSVLPPKGTRGAKGNRWQLLVTGPNGVNCNHFKVVSNQDANENPPPFCTINKRESILPRGCRLYFLFRLCRGVCDVMYVCLEENKPFLLIFRCWTFVF